MHYMYVVIKTSKIHVLSTIYLLLRKLAHYIYYVIDVQLRHTTRNEYKVAQWRVNVMTFLRQTSENETLGGGSFDSKDRTVTQLV